MAQLLDSLFQECRRQGEFMVLDGLITVKEIDDAKSGKASGRVISIGLPAYCLFQMLLRSAKANSTGILLGKEKHYELIYCKQCIIYIFCYTKNCLL